MARANDNGWDFVKVGEVYQYKEEGHIMMVEVMENDSDSEYYHFIVKVLEAPSHKSMIGMCFNVSHSRNPGGYWNNMIQFYETPKYI